MPGRVETEIVHNADGSLGVYGNGTEFYRFDGDAGTARRVDSGAVEGAVAVHDLMESVLGADGASLGITETAGDLFRNIGTNQLLIDGEAAINETEASVGLFAVTLPDNYVPGGALTIRAGAGVILAGDAVLTSATIDFSAFLQGTDGSVGSDLVTTAATAITAVFGNKDFTVTPTGLVPGDRLICKVTTSVVEEAAGTGAANARITRLQLLAAVNG